MNEIYNLIITPTLSTTYYKANDHYNWNTEHIIQDDTNKPIVQGYIDDWLGRKKSVEDKKWIYKKYIRRHQMKGNIISNLIPTALWLTTIHSQVPTKPIRNNNKHETLKVLYKWKVVDFEFHTAWDRVSALIERSFIPENVLPLGLEIWGDRIFVSLPSWKPGRPVTLATLPRYSNTQSPLLKPYPDWRFHNGGNSNCSGLTSIFRMNIDDCGRLWVLDSGVMEAADNPHMVCPPAIFIFDLKTDELISKHEIPDEFILVDSLFTNIVVDTNHPNGNCLDAHAYIADTWGFSLLVFREFDATFWKFNHHLFYPDPEASSYQLHGVRFQWTDGIFGLSLSPQYQFDKYLFLHSLSSYREIVVKTSVLRNPYKTYSAVDDFMLVGESKGLKSQSSASAIDKHGVMFFGLVSRDSVGCWDTNKPLLRRNLHVVAENDKTLIFPNDLKVDREFEQHLWVLSNGLPIFQSVGLDIYNYNFYISYGNVKNLVRGSVCDKKVTTSAVSSMHCDKFCF